MKILFICSKNKWRSPTAVWLFHKQAGLAVRSAGVSKTARHTVTFQDVIWADSICCMEKSHAQRLQALFPKVKLPPVTILEIPDEYPYRDPELIEELQTKVSGIIESLNRYKIKEVSPPPLAGPHKKSYIIKGSVA